MNEEKDKNEVPEGYWKTKAGHLLKITEMDTSHLFNVLRHIENNAIKRYTAIVNYTKDRNFYDEDLYKNLTENSDKYIEVQTEYNKRHRLGSKYKPWYWLKNPPINGIDRVLYREDMKNGRYTYDFHIRTRRQDKVQSRSS